MESDDKYPRRIKVSTEKDDLFYERSDKRRSPETSPSYQIKNGSAANPTGDVLVRFTEGLAAVDFAKSLREAGYNIVHELPWAKQAAMVRASSGSIADSLNMIDALEKIQGVENVEPQMIGKRASRGAL
jgi:hypothetical protein